MTKFGNLFSVTFAIAIIILSLIIAYALWDEIITYIPDHCHDATTGQIVECELEK